jgi:DNA helicase HerA-like ATPase
MAEREVIGWVIDNSAHDRFSFVVLEGKRVEFGRYYLIRHPTKGVDVLTRAMGVSYRNPEMDISRYGPRYGKKGIKLPAADQEILVADAEPLGYFDGDKFRPLEIPPATWTPVYEAKPEDLNIFIAPAKDGYYLKIGNLRGLNIPIYLDVNGLVKGHCFVCGMTRSGKSTFVMALAKGAKEELDPPPHMVIFDRRGEYSPLVEKAGGKKYSYKEFTQSFAQMDPSQAASMLRFAKGALAELVASAIGRMQADGIVRVSKEDLRKYILEEIESKGAAAQKRRYAAIAEDCIERYGGVLEALPEKPLSPVDVVRENEITLIDFSVDTEIDSQQMVASNIVRSLLSEAMTNDDFGAVIAIEEVQYFAPEESMVKYGENWRTSLTAITEAISQGGGYNLGFIIMTQRPAYVAKSVISQCNSVISFRLMSQNDQWAIINYTEYGSKALAQYLAGLADHEAFICGIAVPTRFPVIVETRIECYPKKAAKTAKETFEVMKKPK